MSDVKKAVFARGRYSGWLLLFVLFQPLLDILTSIGAQAKWPITVGAVVRLAVLVAVGCWLLVVRGYPGRKQVLACLGVTVAYLAAYSLSSLLSGGITLLVEDLSEGLKVFYCLFFAMFLYALYRKEGSLLPMEVIAASGAGYCLVILIGWLTGTSFASYNAGYGYCGWFYAANDISNIILLTAPLVLYFGIRFLSRDGKPWYQLAGMGIAVFSVIFSSAFIGTKLVYLGVALYLAAALCWFLIRYLQTRKQSLKRGLVVTGALLLILLAMYPVSPLNAYIEDVYVPMNGEDPDALEASEAIPGLIEVDRAKKHREMEEAAHGTWLGTKLETSALWQKLDWVLSKRLLFIAPILQEYLDGGPEIKLLGLGYGQRPGYEKDVEQLVEMEGLMFLIRHGIVGFCVFYLPWLGACLWLIVRFFRQLKQRMGSLLYCSVLFSTMVALAASLIVGHIFQATSVSLFAVLLYGWIFRMTVRGTDELPQF